MSLYDLLVSSESVRSVSLLWVRETYLRESVRLGGRGAELIYKGSLLDISRSFVGPIDSAVVFSIYNDCWDGMLSTLTEEDGVLSGLHIVTGNDLPERLDDLRDYSPRAIFSLDLVRVLSGDSVLWSSGTSHGYDISAHAGQGPAIGGASPSGNVIDDTEDLEDYVLRFGGGY